MRPDGSLVIGLIDRARDSMKAPSSPSGQAVLEIARTVQRPPLAVANLKEHGGIPHQQRTVGLEAPREKAGRVPDRRPQNVRVVFDSSKSVTTFAAFTSFAPSTSRSCRILRDSTQGVQMLRVPPSSKN